DDKGGGSFERRAGLFHERHDLEVGFPLPWRGFAANVAALTVVELDERILLQNGVPLLGGRGPVTAGGDRRANELGGDRPAAEVVEINEQIIGPVLVNVAGDDDWIERFPLGKKF